MLEASVTLDPDFRVAEVQRRTFGSFVEHLGRCVYAGIFEPGHQHADDNGFRKDVLQLVNEMGVSMVRYPGGNFVSGYRWEDGVGPIEQRPTRLDTAWHSLETNTFGPAEFATWARRAGVEPMMAVNLGTRGVTEACDLLEYCNHPDGSYWSEMRIAHGYPAAFDIKLWCLGNELDGPWQLGHKTANEYGRLAAETARAMRMIDPSVELIACGSSNSEMATFGEWEASVLEHAYDEVDYISLHAYYEEKDGDLGSFLASAVDMESFINNVVATADHVRAKTRRKKRINLSFDEWNVWYQEDFHREGLPKDWPVAPHLIEDTYNIADAVVVGSLLITLLRHSDRVTAACQAQLVNVIAPIRAEPNGPAWRQTTFHPFAQSARLARGDVLRVEPTTPTYDNDKFGETAVIDAVATFDEDRSEIAVFVVSRHLTDSVALSIGMQAFPGQWGVEHLVLADNDSRAANTQDTPNRVTPRPADDAHWEGSTLHVLLPPLSWNVLRLRRERAT